MILFCYAFIYYKKYMPEKERPFNVPGGVTGAVIVSIPVVGLLLVYMYYSLKDDEEVFNIPYGKAVFCAAVTFGGLLVHLIIHIKNSCCSSKSTGLNINDDGEYKPLLSTFA